MELKVKNFVRKTFTYGLIGLTLLAYPAMNVKGAGSQDSYLSKVLGVKNTIAVQSIDCKHYIPTEDQKVYLSKKEVPEVIKNLDSFIFNHTKQLNIDTDIIVAFISASFSDYGSTLNETTNNLLSFLNTWMPQLEKNLQRYNGDYAKAIEALYRGTEGIDMIVYLYGNEDWYRYIREIPYRTGDCYYSQETLAQTLYYQKVLEYYWRYKVNE